jgi:hypothetical protein
VDHSLQCSPYIVEDPTAKYSKIEEEIQLINCQVIMENGTYLMEYAAAGNILATIIC